MSAEFNVGTGRMPSILEILSGPLLPGTFMFAASTAFFLKDKSSSFSSRIFSSAHGFLGALIFLGAVFVWQSGRSNDSLLLPYAVSFLLPLGSIVFSLFRFSGNKRMHLLHIPILLCLVAAFFVGSMLVTNDFL
jgi:hypothetical protein